MAAPTSTSEAPKDLFPKLAVTLAPALVRNCEILAEQYARIVPESLNATTPNREAL